MSSEPFQINYLGLTIGVLAFSVTILGLMALLFTQKAIYGLPFVLAGFTVFMTAMMMCAKTTGGTHD